jgi:hypothetical protein
MLMETPLQLVQDVLPAILIAPTMTAPKELWNVTQSDSLAIEPDIFKT